MKLKTTKHYQSRCTEKNVLDFLANPILLWNHAEAGQVKFSLSLLDCQPVAHFPSSPVPAVGRKAVCNRPEWHQHTGQNSFNTVA